MSLHGLSCCSSWHFRPHAVCGSKRASVALGPCLAHLSMFMPVLTAPLLVLPLLLPPAAREAAVRQGARQVHGLRAGAPWAAVAAAAAAGLAVCWGGAPCWAPPVAAAWQMGSRLYDRHRLGCASSAVHTGVMPCWQGRAQYSPFMEPAASSAERFPPNCRTCAKPGLYPWPSSPCHGQPQQQQQQ
jgi:hypothetical protein